MSNIKYNFEVTMRHALTGERKTVNVLAYNSVDTACVAEAANPIWITVTAVKK